MSEAYNCLKGRGCHGRGMQQVSTQGIAHLVEKWSFVILGED